MQRLSLIRPFACAIALCAAGACATERAVDAVPELRVPAEGALADNGCTTDPNEAIVWDFDWSDVAGATTYELWVKHRSSPEPEVDVTGLPTSSHRVGRFATTDGEFLRGWEWKVRAQVNGVNQPWSKTATFNLEPPDTDCQ
jgi:hypothetical protein